MWAYVLAIAVQPDSTIRRLLVSWAYPSPPLVFYLIAIYLSGFVRHSNQKISEHTFTAKFTYDGTLATCYETDSTILMIDHDSNLRPKAENEGRYNLTPTQVYGHVTFVLYNTDDSVNSEATIKIYCNQDGEIWVNRQG